MERRSFERVPGGIRPRRKFGLETPLVGRFAKEKRRLVFAPPSWYDGLVVACVAGGFLMTALSVVQGNDFGAFVFILVLFSGIWGAISNERMLCNLTDRTYLRVEGFGLKKRVVRGSIGELDAVVLVAEEIHLPTGRHVIYRLALHWKGATHPVLVIGREDQGLELGAPINQLARNLQGLGLAYAQALGVKFFDNSYYSSPAPIPVA